MPRVTLALAGVTHAVLQRHLFPGDGNEAAAVLICSHSRAPHQRLIVQRVILVPHAACSLRAPDAIIWPGSFIEEAIDAAEEDGLVILLLHSHPGGWLDFSEVDDKSDARVIPGLFEAFGDRHGSAVMTPDGAIRARLYARDMSCQPVDLVTITGHDIHYWWNDRIVAGRHAARPLAFTGGMTSELSRLSVAVIGVSGTGSIVAEQAARLGFGSITLVDPDRIETKNLNRILNSTDHDALNQRLKVEAFAEAITSYRGQGVASAIPMAIDERRAIEAVARCDVIFCCVDTQEGRQFADLIAAAFLIPLFDVGVVIPTCKNDGKTEIADVCGRIDYVQPGGASLSDRGVYTPEGLRAEYVRRTDPQAYGEELAAGYIRGVAEEAPSVITLNMRASSAAVIEFIARAYMFRQEPNRLYARTMFSIAACDEDHYSEDDFQHRGSAIFGQGAKEPLLGLPALRPQRESVA